MKGFAAAENCWPTKEQELLLRACLLSGAECQEAWEQWRRVFEKGYVDKGSQRLLPLLYRNLQSQGIQEPSVDRFKAEYFRTWSQNQFSFRRAAPLIDAFNQAGIQTMILKGAALALHFYEDIGLRPMMDFDLLVHRNQVKLSMQLLSDLDWKSRYPSPEALVPFEQAGEFRDSGNQNLDLHWRVLWEGRQGLGDDEFWAGNISTEIEGVPTHSLNSADQLLHVCVHGAKWNDTSSLRWIADAMMIIRSQKLKIDWARLVRQAQKRHLTLPMRDTLSYLDNLLGAGIPLEVLNNLKNIPTSKLERTFYQIRLGSNDTLKTLPVLWHWINSLWFDCDGHLPRRLFQFLQYLQSLWKLKRLWHVPFYLVAKPVQRIYHSFERA